MANRNSELQQFSVDTNLIPDDTVDCGIKRLNWCRGPSCQKYARLRTFIIVLAIAGLLQGVSETYFRISAKQAAIENNYNPIIVEWLVVSSGLFQAFFGILFAFWAHKWHHINWLSGIIIIQSVSVVIAMIPAIINYSDGVSVPIQTIDSNVCKTTIYAQIQKNALTANQSHLITLILLFVLQLIMGLAALAFYTIGLVYVDDNSLSIDSPAAIGFTWAAKILGTQVGSILSIGVEAINIGWWLGWMMLAPALFISGVLLGLFPRRLPKTVIHQAAQRIIEDTRNFGSQFVTYIDDTSLIASMKRLFTNKLLQCNLLSIMFIQSAIINYVLQEESYLQSRYYLPFNEEDGLQQEWNLRFVSYFLRPPIMAIGMLVGGLVISKLKLSGRKITGITIALGVHLLVFYVIFIFLKCDVGSIAGISGGKLQQTFCSRNCICTANIFSPVCPENSAVTYFSPCYAGCTNQTNINNVELYDGCSCANDPNSAMPMSVRATAGSCSAEQCAKMLIVFQALTMAAAGLIGIMMISKLLITLRSVLPQDKPLALAMELLYVGFFAYIPVHLSYDVVTSKSIVAFSVNILYFTLYAGTTCLYWNSSMTKCLLRETPKHGDILNILTASLILVGVLFDILVFVFAKNLNMYNCKVTDVNYTPSLYSPVPHDEHSMPMQQAMGGSPATTMTTASPAQQQRRQLQQQQPQQQQQLVAKDNDDGHKHIPTNDITVFRNPSSVTSGSSTEETASHNTGVTYAQVIFPPDKHKPNDGSTSPKRFIPRADVPQHHLSDHDVRAQLGNLKSFTPQTAAHNDVVRSASTINGQAMKETTPSSSPSSQPSSQPSSTQATKPTQETDLDEIRPMSPETDF